MATSNYSWNLPTVGGSEDTWGTSLNANWTALDTLLGGVSQAQLNQLDGNIFTGNLIVTGNVGIGTTNPGTSLDVLGGIRARGGAPGGGASNNGYAFTSPGDTDSGMFSSADGQIEFYTNNVERARFNNFGNLRIGTTAFGGGTDSKVVISSTNNGAWNDRLMTLEILGNNGPAIGFHDAPAANAAVFKFWGPAGEFEFRNSDDSGFLNAKAQTFINMSDYRLKENVAPITDATSKVMALQPRSFTWTADNRADLGFIAHELQQVVPEAVYGEKDAMRSDGTCDYQGVSDRTVVAVLTAALQEALQKIEALEARVTALEA